MSLLWLFESLVGLLGILHLDARDSLIMALAKRSTCMLSDIGSLFVLTTAFLGTLPLLSTAFMQSVLEIFCRDEEPRTAWKTCNVLTQEREIRGCTVEY
jgi:hypothetical protein